MEDLTFLEQLDGDYSDSNNATLKVVVSEGQVFHISDRISPYRLLDSCPLLYHAFEYGYQSRLQASIEAPSRAAVISLLRYCYTGSYLPPGLEYAPILLLPHAETYKIAEDFDVPELQLLAHGNFSVQVNCASSLPSPPDDLLETIRYVYTHFSSAQSRQQQGLVHTLLNYCVHVFQYHKLGESAAFLEVIEQVPEFRQDLCRINMERNFEDECAFDIIRIAIDTLQPQPSIRPTTLASRDLPEVMLFDRPATPVRAPSYDFDMDKVPFPKVADPSSSAAPSLLTLALRPRDPFADEEHETATDVSSEDEGFAIVHRPRTLATATPDEPMSSPEMIPSNPTDILALTGSNYPDDDEWTLL